MLVAPLVIGPPAERNRIPFSTRNLTADPGCFPDLTPRRTSLMCRGHEFREISLEPSRVKDPQRDLTEQALLPLNDTQRRLRFRFENFSFGWRGGPSRKSDCIL